MTVDPRAGGLFRAGAGDGTEEDAVASVRSQIIAMGAEPDDEAIAEIIRNVRNQ
jgi:hypothetical protein